jgi:DMSO/TMAO reductase YedYZ molybdopterin-dependent catalytic subunit
MAGQGYLTPVDRFFVRNHTTTPIIDPATWRLEVFGVGVEGQPERGRGTRFSLADFEKLPRTSATTFVECAGNGRRYFADQEGQAAAGTQWGLGAIGVARWTGVALGEVLERVGIRTNALEVMPEGLDAEVIGADGVSQGHVRRPIPLEKALDDAVIAFDMNGTTLPPDHGFPARLIVPGWVGIANIKWIGSIRVSIAPMHSAWNTTQYRKVGPSYAAGIAPLTTQPLKSAFELAPGATFQAGVPVALRGRSWSGRSRPRSVRVSTDGGATGRARDAPPPRRNIRRGGACDDGGRGVPHSYFRASSTLSRAARRAGATAAATPARIATTVNPMIDGTGIDRARS